MHPVRMKRRQKALTLEELGELTGINFSVISRIERCEQNLTTGHLRLFAQALKCEEKELIPTQEEEAAILATEANPKVRARRAQRQAASVRSESLLARARSTQTKEASKKIRQESHDLVHAKHK